MSEEKASSITAPFDLTHDSFGRLVLTDEEGRRYEGVEPHRAFPISDPQRSISICDTDGHEIRWVDDLSILPQQVREVLVQALARRDFLPVVHRIVKVSGDIEPAEWVVETDRGSTTFVLNSEENVRRLDDRRAMIVDAHGIRYLIPDYHALDTGSRHILERYL